MIGNRLSRIVIAGLTLSAGMLAAGIGPSSVLATSGNPGKATAFALTADPATKTAELFRVNGNSGAIEKSVAVPYDSATDSPDLLLSPDGKRLYLTGKMREPNGTMVEGVSLLDARTLKTEAVAAVPDRILYATPRVGTMALSPNGSRLFLYSQANVRSTSRPETDWLTVLDARTLRKIARNVVMPNYCSPERMATAKTYVLVLCENATALYFVEPRREVVGFLPLYNLLTPASNLTVSPDGKMVYLARLDLGVYAINTLTYGADTMKSNTSAEMGGQPLGDPSTALLTLNGARYLVAYQTHDQGGITGQTDFFALQSLNEVLNARVGGLPYSRIVAAPGGWYSVPPPPPSCCGGFAIRRYTPKPDLREIDSSILMPVKGFVYAFTATG